MFLTSSGVGQSNTSFTFSSSILISFGLITTLKNTISYTFHLYFSGFTYKSFSTNLFTTFSTILSCSFFFSVSIITLSIKLATFPVLIRSQRISFIIVWNIASEFVSPKNIIIGLNNPSGIMNTTFHSSFSFIYTLLYPYFKSIFVNTFFIPIFFTMSEIRGKG